MIPDRVSVVMFCNITLLICLINIVSGFAMPFMGKADAQGERLGFILLWYSPKTNKMEST